MAKKAVTAKLSPKTLDRLEDYAERESISRSEATDRMVKQGLDVEESDMRLIPVRSDGGTIIEDRLDEIEKQQRTHLSEIEENQATAREELTEIQKDLQAQNTVYRFFTWFFALSAVYIGSTQWLPITNWISVAVGTGLLALVLYTLYIQHTWVR